MEVQGPNDHAMLVSRASLESQCLFLLEISSAILLIVKDLVRVQYYKCINILWYIYLKV